MVSEDNFNQIMTQSGLVSGILDDEQGIRKFLGIPFAAPPIGSLRWCAPQDPQPWQGVRRCDAFGAMAPQYADKTDMFAGLPRTGPDSEDCLYLNIWAPAQVSEAKLPVIVYIHGGGFILGDGSIFDGSSRARQGVIQVTFNYRLAIYGTLALPELSQESGNAASGNYNILDQIKALKWVRDNIAAFGGDPENITLEGQSAGAVSTMILLASTLARGLFKRAIVESGLGLNPTFFRFPTLAEAEACGSAFMKAAGASSLKDLRDMPADRLQKAEMSMYVPIIDGYVLTDTPARIFAKGQFNAAQLICGSNRDEIPTMESMPEADFVTPADRMFGWDMYDLARKFAKQADSYLYFFDRVQPGQQYSLHSAEIRYIFGTLNQPGPAWEPVDHQLSETMMRFWINFARTGDPNDEGLPKWQKFSEASSRVMRLGEMTGMDENPRSDSYRFLDQYFKIHGDAESSDW